MLRTPCTLLCLCVNDNGGDDLISCFTEQSLFGKDRKNTNENMFIKMDALLYIQQPKYMC